MHTHVSTDTEAASDTAIIMCIKHVPKPRPFRSAHEAHCGRPPNAAAAPVSSLQLLGGFADQLVEAHEGEVHYADKVSAASCSPARL